ncbi:MAG: chromosome segregation protein SMC, partial [Firmicutes bacterium]|nr:chromosome segregation protein SMC [Bacillota bacterium]
EEMESNYEGYNAGVRSLMKAGLGGIHGVVTELITVPKGYELAIETALGQNLQDIVCEKDEDAKRGVNYLKDNKAGRVTFLPIETIRGKDRDASSIKNDEGFIDLAVNIISCDDKYKEVYKYLLGKVAVAKDMDAAIRLAKKGTGLRFVTKEGEIVNTAGAITGGAYKNRTASFLERKAEIAELAVQLKTLEDIILKDGNALASQKNNLLTMEESIDRLRDEKHQIEITLGALAGDLKAAGDSYSKETSSLTRYEDEMTRIERQLSDIEDLKSGHIKRIDEIKAEIEEVTNAVQAATEKADAQKLITDERSEAVTGARINLNEVSTRVDAQKRLADKVASQIEEYKRQIEEKEQTGTALLAEKEELIELRSEDSAVEEKLNEKETLENSLRDLARDKEAVLNEQKEFELAQGDATNRINDLRDQKYQIEIKSAKGDTQLETLKEKLWEEFEISYAQALDRRVDDFVYSKAVKETREIRSRIRELGDVHVGAIAEYEKESERYEFFTAQRDDITKARDELRSIISDMDKTIRIKFKENFDKVVENFEVIFKELFGGGQAELRLEDENDPLNSGIEIVAQPPGKKLQNINLMSGGEKTMTAIALMFAVLKTKPTPFCILDEVEAALDDNNIDRFANYLKNFQEIQFALVTHQKATMEHADVLYGVTMPEQGISKMLSLRLGDDFDLD